MKQRNLPVKTVEVIDHDKVFEILSSATGPVSFECSTEQAYSIKVAVYNRTNRRLRIRRNRMNDVVLGYSFELTDEPIRRRTK